MISPGCGRPCCSRARAQQPGVERRWAIDTVLRAIQRRLTTADRLTEELRQRSRHRWRALLNAVLQEAAEGVTTVLELQYYRRIERAHGLPRGVRNRQEGRPGAHRYRDVRYEDFATTVELDGREAHPLDEAFRDMHRDNEVRRAGDRILRFGWRTSPAGPAR